MHFCISTVVTFRFVVVFNPVFPSGGYMSLKMTAWDLQLAYRDESSWDRY